MILFKEARQLFFKKIECSNTKFYAISDSCFLLLFLSILAFSTACSNKKVASTPVLSPVEELKLIGEKMKEADNVEYSYDIKFFRSYLGDTSYQQGKIYFEDNLKDSLLGMNFYHSSKKYDSFYNGNFMVNLLKPDSIVYKKPLDDYEDGHMTSYNFLELSYGAIQKFLTDSLLYTSIDQVEKSDTVINGVACDLFRFITNRNIIDTHGHFEGNINIALGIKKDDSRPVFYSQYRSIKEKMGTFHSYSQAIFYDYSFDTKYPASLFSIEGIPSFYRWGGFARSKLLENIKAPDWSLPDLEGNTLTLSSLKGKIVLLNFWFIGCGGVVQSIPVLNKLQAKYKDNDFVVLGVNCYSDKVDKIKEYSIRRNMLFNHVWKGTDIGESYKVEGAPVFYLLDKEGNIIYSQSGENNEKLETNVDAYMAQLR